MPLICLFLVMLALAISPKLLVFGLIIWGLNHLVKRERGIQAAGINAAFGGKSMADAAVLRGRKHL